MDRRASRGERRSRRRLPPRWSGASRRRGVIDPSRRARSSSSATRRSTEALAQRDRGAPAPEVLVRSPLTCQSRHGVCRKCYGRNLATGKLVEHRRGRRHHRRPVDRRAGHAADHAHLPHRRRRRQDITQGLPRVEELFEARMPKGMAIISHIDGGVEIPTASGGRRSRSSPQTTTTPLRVPEGYELLVAPATIGRGDRSCRRQRGGEAAAAQERHGPAQGVLPSRPATGHRRAAPRTRRARVRHPAQRQAAVENGQMSGPATQITEGPINPQEYLQIRGREAVQRYLVKEVQRVYRSQGVTINDKHIEIIVRQMLRKVRVDQPGDTELLPFELSTASSSRRSTTRSWPRAASRRRRRPCCSASPRRRSTPAASWPRPRSRRRPAC